MRCVDGVRRLWLRLFGVSARTIDTAQGQINLLEVEGTGPLPPILLVHGLSSSAVDWGPVIRQLRGKCQRIRAIDLPGHGLSDTPRDGMGMEPMRDMITEAAEDFLDHPQIIVGNSLGGLAAVRIAGQKPQHTLALVLISPGGTPIPQTDLDALLDRFHMDTWAKAHAFIHACLGGPYRRRFDLAWGVRARIARPSIQSLVGRVSRSDLLAPEELSTLQMPIFLFWGQDDEILPEPHLDFYRSHLPSHTEVHRPEGMGHAPFMDNTQQFLEPVLEFCDRLSSKGQPPGVSPSSIQK
jgi:pimeloyl-ACP methyl ester carboxylesterase